jgi:hypothetical protein
MAPLMGPHLAENMKKFPQESFNKGIDPILEGRALVSQQCAFRYYSQYKWN